MRDDKLTEAEYDWLRKFLGTIWTWRDSSAVIAGLLGGGNNRRNRRMLLNIANKLGSKVTPQWEGKRYGEG